MAVLWAALIPPALEVPPAGTLLLRGVTLVEPGQPRRRGVDLVVRDGEIAAIGSGLAEKSGVAPAVAGLHLLPGLIDLHVHHPPAWPPGVQEAFGLLFLAHGVTTVRDAGSFRGGALALGERIARGERPGPRVFGCGPFLDGERPVWPGSLRVDDAESAQRAIDELRRAGARCAKLYNGLEPAAVRALLDAAAAVGLPVIGHVSHALSIRALPGVEVQHLMGAAPHWGEVGPREIERYVRVSAARGITHTPTLVAVHQLASDAFPPAAKLLPRFYRDVLWDRENSPRVARWLGESDGDPAGRLRAMQRLVAALHTAGVDIRVGTDTPAPGVVPGLAVREELALLVASGLSLDEVWIAATRGAGSVLGAPLLGRLVPGAPADLLLFREDPTRDLAALDTLELVVAAGRVYTRNELETELSELRRYFESPLYDLTGILLARLALAW